MAAEVVTCSKVIALHSIESRQPLNSFTHHRGIVNCVNVNHTNKVIGSCGQDGKIFLVTADKPENYIVEYNFYPNYKEKPSSLTACAFSPNSKYIAVGSVDSLVKVWDLRGQSNPQKEQNVAQVKSHMCGVTSIAWLKNLRPELTGSDILASASSSGDIYFHSNKTGSFQEVMALKLQEGINCIRTSQSMDYCRMAACTNGGTLAVWDLMSGKDKPIWTTAPSSPNDSKASMTSLSISSYSPVLLVTSSVDETLTFFDIQEKKSVKKITAEQPLSCVGLHSNGHTLVAGGMYGNCYVYDLRNPSKPQSKLAGHDTTIKHLQFFKSKDKDHSHSSVDSKSKAPSAVSVNSNTSIPPAVSQHHKPYVPPASSSSSHAFPAQPEVKSKENIKLPEAKSNNFMGNNVSYKSAVTQQTPRERKIESKLSGTAQEMMRNNAMRSDVLPNFSETGGSQTSYKPRTKESIRPQPYQTHNVHSSQNVHSSEMKEMREMRQKMSSLQGEVKQVHSDMFQMEERLNLSMIRQFQLHQTEMASLLHSLVSKQKEKDEQIKRLENENARLRSSTF